MREAEGMQEFPLLAFHLRISHQLALPHPESRIPHRPSTFPYTARLSPVQNFRRLPTVVLPLKSDHSRTSRAWGAARDHKRGDVCEAEFFKGSCSSRVPPPPSRGRASLTASR